MRRRKFDPPGNNERWMVSYADFITLLFAFFVVMYSISSVSAGKYRVLSESIQDAFQQPFRSIDPVQLGSLSHFLSNFDTDHDGMPVNTTINNPDESEHFSQEIPLKLFAQEAQRQFKGLIRDGKVTVRDEQDWLEVEIRSSLLFNPGGAFLSTTAELLIAELAEVVKKFPNPIVVEGFTDNVPIANEIYPTNWELSADRATSVVRSFIEAGVDPARLAAMGYGENFPIGDNATPEGRDKNRRVILLIEKDDKRRRYLAERSVKPTNIEDSTSVVIDEPLDDTIILQDEVVIEREVSKGNEIRGIVMPDGSIKYSAQGIYEEKESANESPEQ